jgi:hypothetical protein
MHITQLAFFLKKNELMIYRFIIVHMYIKFKEISNRLKWLKKFLGYHFYPILGVLAVHPREWTLNIEWLSALERCRMLRNELLTRGRSLATTAENKGLAYDLSGVGVIESLTSRAFG